MSSAMLTSLRSLLRDENFQQKFCNAFDGGVWYQRARSDAPLPRCVYDFTTLRFQRCSKGTDHVARVVFAMYCRADSTGTLSDAQDRLRTLLDGTVLTASGYDRVLCQLRQHGTPTLEDDAWSVTDEYELRGILNA